MHSAIAAIALLAICDVAAAQTAAPQAVGVAPKHFEPIVSSNPNLLMQAIAGNGVTLSNPVLNSTRFAAGTFGDSLSTLGIEEGIVLATGDIRDYENTNGGDSVSTNFGLAGDAQLDALVAPNKTFDAASFEFDVTTSQSTIGISYVFASEEYNSRVGQPSDVMAIFINGVNCANVNGQRVSVNTVNATSNSAQFVDNARGVRLIEMNGLTRPLECVAQVTPNTPVRVRIAIADTGDGTLDSAVMIAAEGVYAPGIGPPTTSGPPVAGTANAVEYYHRDFDHFFATTIADEITKLDNGTFVGWTRTGLSFKVFTGGSGNPPVCRFFSTAFGPKSSHFYTPNAAECATVKTNADWQFEGEVFNVALPSGAMTTCAAGTQPLYRMYNNGQGGAPNHRYTTDLAVRTQMLGLGWIPEGDGIGVIACVPT